jgi:hypothetical protein
MPAYSGGNRWVGVVSLKEPPVAVPLHKMAAIKQSLSRLGRITVAPGKLMSVRQVCRVLQRLAERHALDEDWRRATYYFEASPGRAEVTENYRTRSGKNLKLLAAFIRQRPGC